MATKTSLMDRLKSNSTIKATEILKDSKFFNQTEVVHTGIPSLDILLSGDVDGGFSPGITILAGASKSFKTMFSLIMAKKYMDKYPESVLMFYNCEFGTSKDYFNSLEIDMGRVMHIPILNLEELKFDMVNQLEGIERGDKVIFVVDSIGNIASKKEVDDAKDEKSVADMSRAKQIKSFFRIITPYMKIKNIPCVIVAHIYQTQEIYSKAVVSGGCLVSGTKLQMSDNTLKEIQNIKVGEQVRTAIGDKVVTSIWNPDTLHIGIPECYEIQFDDGYSVTCSNNHSFLTIDGWTEAKNLKIDTPVTTNGYIGKTSGRIVKSINIVGKLPVYDISVYEAEHYILENGVVTHNTGPYYSADTIFIIGRQQEKDGTELIGHNFVVNVEKSRVVIEKSKIPITVKFDGGLSTYTGLIELGLQSGLVIKPVQGWYSRVFDTGEIEAKKWRLKETDCSEFWTPILDNPTFKKWVIDNFKLSTANLFGSSIVPIDVIEDEID